MDFRKVFDRIPEEFEKWRPRYCDELFTDVIEHSKLGSDKTILEIGPGTGQATEPFLKTGCSYMAIELGEHLLKHMTLGGTNSTWYIRLRQSSGYLKKSDFQKSMIF
jgi:hypothetical protein